MGQRNRYVEQGRIDGAGDQVVGRGCRPSIGHVQDVDAGLVLQKLDGEMRDAAGAGRAAGDLARLGLGGGNELLEVVDAQFAVHHQQFLHARHEGERRDVLFRIVGHARHQMLHDDGGRGGHHAHDGRVTAGLGDEVDSGDARRAALVLGHHRLAEPSGHRLREIAAKYVRGAAGGKGDDERQGPAGKGRLRARAPDDERSSSETRNGAATGKRHGFLQIRCPRL